MGFKITHPLFPHWLLVWPLWHTSTQRLRVPPDRMSGTTDTTKWPHCLHFYFVLVVFVIYRRIIFFTFFTVGSWISFPHLLLVVILHQRLPRTSPLFSLPVFIFTQSCFSFLRFECLLISISVWMSLHLWPPRPSFLRCILFIIPQNWFHSLQAYPHSTDW